MLKGLFKLKSTKKNQVEGTAFAIDRTRSINRYLIVTAYSVISEINANNDSIVLEDEDGFLSSAILISSIKSFSDYINPESNYAVLEAFINKDYEIYKPINYTEINNFTRCLIRGVSTYTRFRFASFTAIYGGAIKTKFGKHILCLIDTMIDYHTISAEDLFKGTSGSPVTVNYLGQEFCIGILSPMIETYPTLSLCAVPIFYVANEVTDFSPEVFDSRGLLRNMRNYVSTNSKNKPSIFISYNSNLNDYVDDLEITLQNSAKIIRYTHQDSSGVGTWESFRNFMKSIRDQDFAVLIISKNYLESEACIYEVMQLWKDEKLWDDKVMYIVTNDADIYNPFGRLNYVKYWQKVYHKYVEETSDVDISNAISASEQAKLYQMYAANIGEFLEKVADSNNPKQESAADKILERITKNKYRVCE